MKRTINFQGNIDLDQKIVDQLESYLDEREGYLSGQLLNLWQPASLAISAASPTLVNMPPKLGDAVEDFCRKLRSLEEGEKSGLLLKEADGETVVKEVNKALWEYAEVLEGCVTELFQQLKSISIERWQLSLLSTIQVIKDLLLHRLEDLLWLIKRLEKPIAEYSRKAAAEKKPSLNLFKKGGKQIDPALLGHLEKSESLLKSHFQEFNNRYHEYLYLSGKVEDYLQTVKHFHLLALIENQDQSTYVHLIRLLKLLEFNQYPKKEVGIETIRALKNLASIDSITRLFKRYLKEFQNAFYKSSLEWKSLSQDKEHYKEAADRLRTRISEDKNELEEFLQVMSRYRRFMLKNDSNPYVSSRWGFSEWLVGPEPESGKQLLLLIYQGEELLKDSQEFIRAISEEKPDRDVIQHNLEVEIEALLHEMGQPLISRARMTSRAAQLLEKLKAYDEIGSPSMEAILFSEHVFSVAMREDWKYHVLHESPLFHHLYRLHIGVAEHPDDGAHSIRLERFSHLIEQIKTWIVKEDVYAHVHEIQMDISDLKTYLQEFLAAIQRSAKDKSNDPFFDDTLHKYHQQLLEYRYLFGGFFSMIVKENRDGQDLRNQFLFVDQYFETLENLINELRLS